MTRLVGSFLFSHKAILELCVFMEPSFISQLLHLIFFGGAAFILKRTFFVGSGIKIIEWRTTCLLAGLYILGAAYPAYKYGIQEVHIITLVAIVMILRSQQIATFSNTSKSNENR